MMRLEDLSAEKLRKHWSENVDDELVALSVLHPAVVHVGINVFGRICKCTFLQLLKQQEFAMRDTSQRFNECYLYYKHGVVTV